MTLPMQQDDTTAVQMHCAGCGLPLKAGTYALGEWWHRHCLESAQAQDAARFRKLRAALDWPEPKLLVSKWATDRWKSVGSAELIAMLDEGK